MAEISVVIPVGPAPHHKRWLNDAIESVLVQRKSPADVVIVNDMADLSVDEVPLLANRWVREYRMPWLSGVPHSFNAGVAVAETELVFMLGSDDIMLPRCLELCDRQFEKVRAEHGDDAALNSYFFVPVTYMMGNAPDQFTPCGEAMVSKTLWRNSGGFPVEASVGRADTVFHTMLHGRPQFRFEGVGDGTPLVSYRSHPDSDTEQRRGHWHGLADAIANLSAQTWKGPEWGRYA